MATRGKKISEQTLAASLDGNEVIPFAKNSANGAVKASKIKEYVQPDLTAKQDKLVNSSDVTISIDSKLTVTDLAKNKAFIDQCKAIGVVYNYSTGYFECNGINDLTISDARNIDIAYAQMRNTRNAEFMFAIHKFRTLPKVSNYVGGDSVSADRMFQLCNTLESIDLSGVVAFSNMIMMFRFCSNLHTIKGLTMAQNMQEDGASGAFTGCVKLRNVELRNTKVNISFSDSPLLSLDSIQYLVDNAANTSPITVTLHPDAYARLTDEIITAATAKQINFATETA